MINTTCKYKVTFDLSTGTPYALEEHDVSKLTRGGWGFGAERLP
jgi:hypothetical protein